MRKKRRKKYAAFNRCWLDLYSCHCWKLVWSIQVKSSSLTKQWQKGGHRKMTNRQVCKHQTIQLWGRIIWENICFKINSKALYRILENKEKDIEFIEGKSWQDIMMKYFHFIAKEKRKEKSLWRFPAFLLFPPKAICDIAIENMLWICTVIPQSFT